MKKYYVHFQSPGTFVAEDSSEEIDRFRIKKAIAMSKKIKERHGATPYGFYFTVRKRGRNDLDSKQTYRSRFFWLGGKILTLDDIKSRNDPNDSILISNMECNDWDKIVVNTNSWRWTMPLNKTDIVLKCTS